MAGFSCTRLEEQEIHIPDTSSQCLSVAVLSFKAYIHSQPPRVMISSLHVKRLQFIQWPNDIDGLLMIHRNERI